MSDRLLFTSRMPFTPCHPMWVPSSVGRSGPRAPQLHAGGFHVVGFHVGGWDSDGSRMQVTPADFVRAPPVTVRAATATGRTRRVPG